MGRGRGGRGAGAARPRRGWRSQLAVLVLALTAAVTPVAASGSTTDAKPELAQVGHVAFWECHAKTTQLLVAVNTLTLHPGASLTISFTVRNGAATACNYTAPYAATAPGPAATTLQAGPCGSIGFEIVGPNHRNVWPGAQVVNCPALGFAQLQPDATVSGTGSWNQTKPNSTARVAAGTYTIVVDNTHFSFPLRVAKS